MRLTVKQAWRVVALAFWYAATANPRNSKRNAMGMCYFIRHMHEDRIISARVRDTMLKQIDTHMAPGVQYLFPLNERGDMRRAQFAKERAK